MDEKNFNMPFSDDIILNYHLMHPGGKSSPGDPNAAFFIDGTYHLHYILRHPWRVNSEKPSSSKFISNHSFSFIHVTSQDMLHWEWKKTKLQPSFTGHGMFSGTGFMTKDGKPAVIYHGQGSDRNHISIAKDNSLSNWEKPYSLEPIRENGKKLKIRSWDPDCFLLNDTYYSIYGGKEQPLIKSQDLVNWTYVGDFLKHEMPDVVIGEDISCPNFFPLGDKWILLCISHQFGCRYYIGDWDGKSEQFVPETHGRMNWRFPDQSTYNTKKEDFFFAPESLGTPDGRRVMWAWLACLNGESNKRTIQSLPRELSLEEDGVLRIRPLRELEFLRYDPLILNNIKSTPSKSNIATERIASLEGDSFEIKISIDRSQANRMRFSVQLFSDSEKEGLIIMIQPESGTIRIGFNEAPFAVDDLPPDEDLELRIFLDKYLVEVFANERQAIIGTYMDHRSASGLSILPFDEPIMIRKVEVWKIKATNQGFYEAMENRIWEPDTEI